MVDNVNPTSQFHPYVPQDATPQTGNTPSSMSGLGGILNKLNAGQTLKNARGYAQNNGSLVLGGLAALAIGAGLMRKRSMSRG